MKQIIDKIQNKIIQTIRTFNIEFAEINNEPSDTSTDSLLLADDQYTPMVLIVTALHSGRNIQRLMKSAQYMIFTDMSVNFKEAERAVYILLFNIKLSDYQITELHELGIVL